MTIKVEKWLIKIKGRKQDKELLVNKLQNSQLSAVIIKNDYYIRVQGIKTDIEGVEIVRNSSNIIQIINGGMKVVYPKTYKTISFNEILIEEYNGNLKTIRFVVRSSNGDPNLITKSKKKDVFNSICELSLSDSLVMDALSIYAAGELNWKTLYILYEIIKFDVGEKYIYEKWCPKNQIKLFTNTTNNYAILKTKSRHGPKNWAPPSIPMELPTAKKIIGEIFIKWIIEKR